MSDARVNIDRDALKRSFQYSAYLVWNRLAFMGPTAPLPVHCVVHSGLSTVRGPTRAGTCSIHDEKNGAKASESGLTARRDGNE
jgi:hypothetical protein